MWPQVKTVEETPLPSESPAVAAPQPMLPEPEKLVLTGTTEKEIVTKSYYYQDIYALAEEVFETEIETVSAKVKKYDSWQRAFLDATKFATNNRKAVFHIYESSHRNLLERYYHKTILSAMLVYVCDEAEELDVPERKVIALARFYAAALTGLSADWRSKGMKGEPEEFLDDLGDMLDGNVRQALERVAGKKQLEV